jgi:hypothetical protein
MTTSIGRQCCGQPLRPTPAKPASAAIRKARPCEVGGLGVEPSPARYQRAVPPRTLTSERLRRQGSNLCFAINSRASCRLDHAGTKGGGSRIRTCETTMPSCALATRRLSSSAIPPNGRRGSRTPKGLTPHPFSRRDTAPMAVLPHGPGRSRTCIPPIKSRRLCRLSYGAKAWPAGIEPARPAFQAGALPS